MKLRNDKEINALFASATHGGAAVPAAPPKDCHATTTILPRYDNKIATLRQQGCHATTKYRETDVR